MTFFEWISAITGGLGGGVGIASAYFSWEQWKKINKKIVMIDHVGRATEVLPAWYIDRMMTDDWLFALALDDGRTVVITRIAAISDDGNWLDVELAEASDIPDTIRNTQNLICAISHDRTQASVQVSKITTALDLRTS